MQLSDLITHPSLRLAIRQWQIDNQEDVTVLGPEDPDRSVIVGYFDLPLKADFDESERTETSDSEPEDATGSNVERYLAERQRTNNGRQGRSSLTRSRTSQNRRRQERARAAANQRSAQAFLEGHRRRILSYLRSDNA